MPSDSRQSSENPEQVKRPGSSDASSPSTSHDDAYDPQEYVRELIVRMGEPIPTAPTVVTPTSSTPVDPLPTRREESRIHSHRMPAPSSMTPAREVEKNSRRRAVQMTVDMDKLREAVNISTSGDISDADYRTLHHHTQLYLLLSLLSMGLCLTFLALSREALSIGHLSSIACLINSGWSIHRFIVSTTALSQVREREVKVPAESA